AAAAPARRVHRRVPRERGPAQHHQPGRLGTHLRQEGRTDRLHPHPRDRRQGRRIGPVHRHPHQHRTVPVTASMRLPAAARTGRRRQACPARARCRCTCDSPIPVLSACDADQDGAMTTRRIMGTEVEYGIAVPGQPGANPMVTSSQVVNAYGARPEFGRGGRARWDYEEESPLRDARGFTYSGVGHDPADALADEDLGLANVILTNGARLYVDHAHPEYSTPEVTNPLDLVLWDKAGERVMAEAARRASTMPNTGNIQLYKNNTDNKGASYGAHENYLMRRQTPFADIVTHLTPFFVTRQVICGAGRVGIGQDGSRPGFQLSQRADFFEVEVGLETTLKRPIIN